jgi:C4-dicarboxylate transporter, DctM subunit
MYPALLKAGYPKALALGLLCAAGTLGIVIPPSIPLILYGVMTQTSIADLFIAGFGPALLLTSLMLVYVRVAGRLLPVQPFQWTRLKAGLQKGVLGLLMPVIILGGIYSGHFTPTESAAVAVVYALAVEMLIYREMGWRDLFRTVTETATLLGGLFPVLLMAVSFTVFLTYQQIPEYLVSSLGALIDSKTSFLIITNLFLLLVGCVMDIGSAILILAPILQPLAASYGMDPVHFGVMTVVNLEIGYLTPPLGLNIIVAMGAFKEEFWTVCRAMLPFMLLMLLGLCIIAWWPSLSLFLLH